MKDNQYNYCNFFLKKQQIIYSVESEEPKAQCKRSVLFIMRIAKDAQCLFCLLACSAKLTGNRNKFQVSAIIVNGCVLKEIAFLHVIYICMRKGKARVHKAQNRFSAE